MTNLHGHIQMKDERPCINMQSQVRSHFSCKYISEVRSTNNVAFLNS